MAISKHAPISLASGPTTPAPLLNHPVCGHVRGQSCETLPLSIFGTPIKTGGPYKKNSAKISERYFENDEPCIEITTKRGETIVISRNDAELVIHHSWFVNKDGYAQTNISKKPILMQRLLLGAACGVEVDHEDQDKLNNRRENLRLATHGQNAANRGKLSLSKNRFKGVKWSKKHNRWFARCTKDGQNYEAGYCATEEEAARAYDELALKLHGEFARINFPESLRK